MRRVLPGVLATAALVVLTWPVATIAPDAGVTGSWEAGLHLAARRGLDHGVDVVFTYGPLGFLGAPRMFFTITGLAALAYTVTVHTAAAVVLFVTGRRLLRPAAAAALTFAVLATMWGEPAEIVPVLVFVACLHALQGWNVPPARFGAAGGAVAGLQLLVKFNTGLLILAMVGVTSVALARRAAPRVVAATAAGFLGVVGAGWLLTGTAPSAFVPFVVNSVHVTAGYTDAMAIEEAGRRWEYVAAIGTVGAVLVLAGAGRVRERRDRFTAVAAALVTLAFLFAKAKHGFVRHDAHAILFFAGLAFVPFAVRWRERARLLFLGAVAVTQVALVLVIGDAWWSHYDVRTKTDRAGGQMADALVPGRRAELMENARSRIISTYPLTATVRDRIGTRPVHVDPFEISVVWAYGLAWSPVPVFQTYSAYTPRLDRLNAEHLASDGGPDLVLRTVPVPVVDGRNPAFESPAYMQALLCHFDGDATPGPLQVLARRPDRCGAARSIGTVNVLPGELVRVPRRAGHLVVGRIDLDHSTARTLRGLAFKPAPAYLDSVGGPSYRLVEATASGPLVFRIPPAARFGADPLPQIDRFRLRGTGAARMRWFAVPVAGVSD